MKTVKDIIEKLSNYRQKNDIFQDMTISDLVEYLPYNAAEQFLKDEVTSKDWEPRILIKETVIKEIKDYMPFAVGKAIGERGLSSLRNISHFKNWMWLIEDEDTLEFLNNDGNYSMYGKPMLIEICKKYDIDFASE